MAKFNRKLSIRAKLETTYGVNPNTAGGDAVLVSNPEAVIMDADEVERDIVDAVFGDRGSLITRIGSGKMGQITSSLRICRDYRGYRRSI
jgi:hypothetical protein